MNKSINDKVEAPKARLLLADDNPAVLNYVSSILADEFEIVATFPDGEAAFRAYADTKVDLLVLDISMGGLSGLELARRLQQQGHRPTIVFLTVHQEPDFVQAAMASGASGYVVKSHLASDLIPAIKATLSGKMFFSPCLAREAD